MPTIITPDFFNTDLSVPQRSTSAVPEVLQDFINKYEPKYLRLMLGAPLFTAWSADYDAAEYDALKALFVQGVESPIANYVYYWYMRFADTQTTGSGEKKLQAQNATDASARYKVAKAWRDMMGYNFTIREALLPGVLYPLYAEPNGYADRRTYNEWTDLFRPLNPFF